MLQDLKILNGEMSLQFDPFQSKYSVTVTKDITELQFEYKVSQDVQVEIFDNDLNNCEMVEVRVSKDDKSESYYFYVLLEDETVNKSIAQITDLEVQVKAEVPFYVVPSIAVVSFLAILFLFVFLFHKKRVKKF